VVPSTPSPPSVSKGITVPIITVPVSKPKPTITVIVPWPIKIGSDVTFGFGLHIAIDQKLEFSLVLAEFGSDEFVQGFERFDFTQLDLELLDELIDVEIDAIRILEFIHESLFLHLLQCEEGG
jgi:hypothetical protein